MTKTTAKTNVFECSGEGGGGAEEEEEPEGVRERGGGRSGGPTTFPSPLSVLELKLGTLLRVTGVVGVEDIFFFVN